MNDRRLNTNLFSKLCDTDPLLLSLIHFYICNFILQSTMLANSMIILILILIHLIYHLNNKSITIFQTSEHFIRKMFLLFLLLNYYLLI